MISSIFYNGDGSTRIFPVTFKINGEDYVRVYVDNVEVVDRTKYDIINNSIVFTSDDIPAVGTDNIKIYVATSSAELGDLGAPLTDITNVSNNLTDIVAVSTQVIPNLPEILLADNNATIATTQANLAIASMGAAGVSEANALASANTATAQAAIATTKASEASASAISANAGATTATTQAGIATTKASEAFTSASEALTYRDEALGFRNEAEAFAYVINPSNLVHITGDEAIAGVKTFSSSPIVPTPTEGNQAVNKDYVDNLKTIATGIATFDAVTNNINLTGIGIGVEIGDVIQISGAEDAKNNSEFTIEVITDDDNVIVNQAHANKGTSKNVATRSGDTDVTVKLLAKWYNAPIGLGQAWINMFVAGLRVSSTVYVNTTGRGLSVSAMSGNDRGFDMRPNPSSGWINTGVVGLERYATASWVVPAGWEYRSTNISATAPMLELR